MSGSQPILTLMAVAGLVFAFGGPALADPGVSIPEPTDLTLFALAFAGLVFGRQAAKRRGHDD